MDPREKPVYELIKNTSIDQANAEMRDFFRQDKTWNPFYGGYYFDEKDNPVFFLELRGSAKGLPREIQTGIKVKSDQIAERSIKKSIHLFDREVAKIVTWRGLEWEHE
jgi:hypothetical protein